MVLVEMWKKLQHSNVVQLREVFTSKAFGEHCTFVYAMSIAAEGTSHGWRSFSLSFERCR